MADPITRRITPGQDPATRLNLDAAKKAGAAGTADATADAAAKAKAGEAAAKPAVAGDASAVTVKGKADATAGAIASAEAKPDADLAAGLSKLKATQGAAKPLQRFKENDPAAVKDVQQKLKDLGHYKGEVDGKYGPDTDKAVREFQAKNKDGEGKDLKPDGSVGDKTKTALDKAAKAKAEAEKAKTDPAGGADKPADKKPEDAAQKPGDKPAEKPADAAAKPAETPAEADPLKPYQKEGGTPGELDNAKLEAHLSPNATDNEKAAASAALGKMTNQQRADMMKHLDDYGGIRGDEKGVAQQVVASAAASPEGLKDMVGKMAITKDTAWAVGEHATGDQLRALGQENLEKLWNALPSLSGLGINAYNTAHRNIELARAAQ